MHFSVIDPENQKPTQAAEMAIQACAAGTDAIMIGGSTGIDSTLLDETVMEIKSKVTVPLIYLPAGSHAISPRFDAVCFMSILNSSDVRFVIGEQAKGAPLLPHLKLEPLAMGYLIIEPGMTVGEVTKANLIAQDDIQGAVGFALAAEFLGMQFFCLEAGSQAPRHVPLEMISAVRSQIKLPIIVTGGIRTAASAKAICQAGADIVMTGGLLESATDIKGELKPIIEAVHSVKN